MFEKFNDIIDAENLNEQQILDLYSDIIEMGDGNKIADTYYLPSLFWETAWQYHQYCYIGDSRCIWYTYIASVRAWSCESTGGSSTSYYEFIPYYVTVYCSTGSLRGTTTQHSLLSNGRINKCVK